MSARTHRRLAQTILLVVAGLIVAFAVQRAAGGGDAGVAAIFDRVLYNLALGGSALVILGRGLLVRRERWVWLLLGSGLALWTAGNTYYSLVLAGADVIPVPSIADGLWLGFYPPAYAAIALLVRSRLTGLRRGVWLDGIIAAFAVGAVCAAGVVEAVLRSAATGSAAAGATNLAYPLADLVLLGVVTFAMALNGWRRSPTWALLGGGVLLFATADALYLWQTSLGTYHYGGAIDTGWLVAGLLFAVAAVRRSPSRRVVRGGGESALLATTGFGLVGIGLLVFGNIASINLPALALATLCVIAVVARMGLSFAESRRESLSDALTGLPNRRRLIRDLRERAPAARRDRPAGLVFFDLNGFKGYNDRFGHPAGDALLVRLSHRLARAVEGHGVAYRMGGDEFCGLLQPGARTIAQVVAGCLAALTEAGDGFAIDASHGLVLLPEDESDPERALMVADQRMYARKHRSRVPAERQTTDALLQVLSERDPDLGDHSDGVAELARETARRLGVEGAELEEIALAARLHDIGKAAVPDAILRKPGPLDAHEREIMLRHPAIGERILRAAPALGQVASMVRSSHERVDGDGYPDGLVGDEIPLGARIIAVCDTFDAIIGARSYSAPRSLGEAEAEIRRCSGTQFDPRVVVAFSQVLELRRRSPEGIAVS